MTPREQIEQEYGSPINMQWVSGECLLSAAERVIERLQGEVERLKGETYPKKLSCEDVGCDCADPNGKFWQARAEAVEARVQELNAQLQQSDSERCDTCPYPLQAGEAFELDSQNTALHKAIDEVERVNVRLKARARELEKHHCPPSAWEQQRERRAELVQMVAAYATHDTMMCPHSKTVSACAELLAAVDAHLAGEGGK